MSNSAYAAPPRQIRSWRGMLPDLPGALCKGRAPDFDGDQLPPSSAAWLITTCCDLCPARRGCWEAFKAAPQDAAGVWAGRYYVTYRGRSLLTDISLPIWRFAAATARAAGYDTARIRALLGKPS